MKYIILSIFLLTILNMQSQDIEQIISKNIICLGEYHYFARNDSIELSIIDSVIKRSYFTDIYIGAEYSSYLEYFFYLEDSTALQTFFINFTNRTFHKDSVSEFNLMQLNYYMALKNRVIGSQINVRFFCYDTHRKTRSLYHSINYILDRNDCNLHDKYGDALDSFLAQPVLPDFDTTLFGFIRWDFLNDRNDLELVFNSYDFQYMEKILNTPFYKDNYGANRESYIFRQFKEKYSKKNQIIAVIGNGHIRKSSENYLGNSLRSKYDGLFKRRTYFIGIIPDGINKEKAILEYDCVILSGTSRNLLEVN